MGMWLIPAALVILVIIAFSFFSTLRVAKTTTEHESENDTDIPKIIEENPTMLNPIIWAYVIVGLFMGIMIFYYWSKSSY